MQYLVTAISESFTTFLIWIPFICFSSLIAIARTSQIMLNNSGKSGHPCLVPDLGGNAFSFSPLRIMFAVGLSYIAFIMLSYLLTLLVGMQTSTATMEISVESP